MTIAHASLVDAQRSAESSLLVPALVLLTLLAAWVAATVIWGFNGFIGGADTSVALGFALVLRATRI